MVWQVLLLLAQHGLKLGCADDMMLQTARAINALLHETRSPRAGD